MLTAGGALASHLGDAIAGDAIAGDAEVRQARMIAEAARTRLIACMSSPRDELDLAEAQGMLDVLRNAQALAGDAEDRVLLHRGLLTPSEADDRAVKRRPVITRSDEPAPPTARRGQRARDLPASRALPPRVLSALPCPGGRRRAARVVASVLGLALLGVAGAILARRGGVRQDGVRLRPARR